MDVLNIQSRIHPYAVALADSCIGGKSSLNLGSFKNQLGTFYPPHRVHLVFDLLATLPPDDLRSGLGEVIKMHWLDSEASWLRLQELLPRAARDREALQ